jgi:hypothetical protein
MGLVYLAQRTSEGIAFGNAVEQQLRVAIN